MARNGGDEASAGLGCRHWRAFQLTGDVVLTVGSGLSGLANQAAQSIFERRWARVTHAMIVAEPGVYLDVDPAAGAVFRPAERFPLWPGRPAGPGGRRFVAAFRHERLAACAETRRRLRRVLAGCEGAPYNLRFVLKWPRAGDESAFCSELVARAFGRVDLPIVPGRREAAVLPHTLDLALRGGPWVDVSAAYRARLGPPAMDRPAIAVLDDVTAGFPDAAAPATADLLSAAWRRRPAPSAPARRCARC